MKPLRPSVAFLLALLFQAPVVGQGDECSAPAAASPGVNPLPPGGASGVVYTNVGATDSAWFGPACAGEFHNDVWFHYTATRAGLTTVSTCTPPGFAAGSLTDTVVAVYFTSACPNGGGFLGCDDDGCAPRSTFQFPTFPGVTYLIRVGSYFGADHGTFYLSIAESAPAVNDDCFGATAMYPGINISHFGGSSVDPAAYGCAPFGAQPTSDVWHKFVASQSGEMKLTISATSLLAVAAYADFGGCGAVFYGYIQPVACSSASTEIQFPVIGGTNYLLRFGLLATPFVPNDLNFVATFDWFASPPNDVCGTSVSIGEGIFPYESYPGGTPGLNPECANDSETVCVGV